MPIRPIDPSQSAQGSQRPDEAPKGSSSLRSKVITLLNPKTSTSREDVSGQLKKHFGAGNPTRKAGAAILEALEKKGYRRH